MNESTSPTQDERLLAALAHGGILLGLLTNGVGGFAVALVIWLVQRHKSLYAAHQALQALVYQVATLVLNVLLWGCWTILYLALLLPPLISNPDAYEENPPATLWLGLCLLVVPLSFWVLSVLYGLWGALRCLNGHDFKYIVINRWLENK